MKPQMEHETGSGFITRVVNKRLEIKHSGVEIPLEQLKAALLGGLHEIYQSDIAYLHITDVPDAAYLQSKLTQLCNSVDLRKQTTAERSHASAHFGSVNDAFGYQQPPSDAHLSHPQPAATGSIIALMDEIKQNLFSDHTIGGEAMSAVETTMMAAADNNRIC